MAYGGKRGSAGERVLEGRHVIGLFCLMLLFSGVFFTLGYVMGKNQFDSPVRAAPNPRAASEIGVAPRSDRDPKRPATDATPGGDANTTATPYPEWEFYHAGEAKKTEDHLKPGAPTIAAKTVKAAAKGSDSTKAAPAATKTAVHAPANSQNAFVLQVAAMVKRSDALALAQNLQQRRFPAFVLTPNGHKYYRVQVGPYADAKSAEAARKGLEAAGFRAILRH